MWRLIDYDDVKNCDKFISLFYVLHHCIENIYSIFGISIHSLNFTMSQSLLEICHNFLQNLITTGRQIYLPALQSIIII